MKSTMHRRLGRAIILVFTAVFLLSAAGCGQLVDQAPTEGDALSSSGQTPENGTIEGTGSDAELESAADPISNDNPGSSNAPDGEQGDTVTEPAVSDEPVAPPQQSEPPVNPDASLAPDQPAQVDGTDPSTTPSETDQSEQPDASPVHDEETESSIPPEEAITVKVVGPDDLLLFEVALAPEGIATAFDALVVACEAEGVTLKYSGPKSSAYIQAIGNYAEKSEGALSGWVYKVNGEAPSVSSGKADVQKGDRVSFYFTLDLGKDVADKE